MMMITWLLFIASGKFTCHRDELHIYCTLNDIETTNKVKVQEEQHEGIFEMEIW